MKFILVEQHSTATKWMYLFTISYHSLHLHLYRALTIDTVTFSREKGGCCYPGTLITTALCWHDWDWDGRAATSALTGNCNFLKVLEECISEVWSDKAVNDKVDRAVEHHKVSDDVVCNPPLGGNIIHAAISVTIKDVWNRWNLPQSFFTVLTYTMLKPFWSCIFNRILV